MLTSWLFQNVLIPRIYLNLVVPALCLAVFKLKLQKSVKWKISTVSKVDDKNKDKTVKSILMRSLVRTRTRKLNMTWHWSWAFVIARCREIRDLWIIAEKFLVGEGEWQLYWESLFWESLTQNVVPTLHTPKKTKNLFVKTIYQQYSSQYKTYVSGCTKGR